MQDRMLRTLIVDDEEVARQVLRRDLGEIPGVEVVGEAEDGETAQQRIESLDPDLVLLDIQMPVKDGFEVVRALQGRLPSIIFVTAYSEHALRAFEVGAADYLLKPFGPDRLLKAIERVREARDRPLATAEQVARVLNADRRSITKIVARHGEDYLLLDLDQVYAFRASGDTVWILTAKRQFRATQTLGALGEKLAGSTFLRVNRSVLVNSSKIAKLSALSSRRWLLTLTNGFECVVSKRNAGMATALLA